MEQSREQRLKNYSQGARKGHRATRRLVAARADHEHNHEADMQPRRIEIRNADPYAVALIEEGGSKMLAHGIRHKFQARAYAIRRASQMKGVMIYDATVAVSPQR